jgi:hypothetical protein
VVVGTEELDGQEDAGGGDLRGDGGRASVGDLEPEVPPADAGQLGAEIDLHDRVGKQGRERDGHDAGRQPDGHAPGVCSPSGRGVWAVVTVTAP